MSRGKGHIPIRTCLSCGRKGSKKGMIRMTLGRDGSVLLDAVGSGPGRGAYLCRRKECIDNLTKAGRINRAFRKNGIAQIHNDEIKHIREEIINSFFP